MRIKKKNRKGFTLVELLVIVSIIGVLVGIGFMKMLDMSEASKITTWEANHRILVSAIAMYVSENSDSFPTNISQLQRYIVDKNFLQGKPKGSTYSINPSTGVLTSTLSDLRVPIPPLIFAP